MLDVISSQRKNLSHSSFDSWRVITGDQFEEVLRLGTPIIICVSSREQTARNRIYCWLSAATSDAPVCRTPENAEKPVEECDMSVFEKLDRVFAILDEAQKRSRLPDKAKPQQDAEPQQVESPYLNAKEAAAYLRITMNGLYGLVERRKLKPLPGHRKYRFTKEMLDAYLRGK